MGFIQKLFSGYNKSSALEHAWNNTHHLDKVTAARGWLRPVSSSEFDRKLPDINHLAFAAKDSAYLQRIGRQVADELGITVVRDRDTSSQMAPLRSHYGEYMTSGGPLRASFRGKSEDEVMEVLGHEATRLALGVSSDRPDSAFFPTDVIEKIRGDLADDVQQLREYRIPDETSHSLSMR